MAAIGGRRYVKKLGEAMKRAGKLGHNVYLVETARTWDIYDVIPDGGFRRRRWTEVAPDRLVGAMRSS